MGRRIISSNARIPWQNLIRSALRNGEVNKFKVPTDVPGYINDEADHFGYYLQKGLFEEYANFGRGHGHDLAPFDTYHQYVVYVGQLLTVKKPYGVTVKALTRMLKQVKMLRSTAIQIKKRLF